MENTIELLWKDFSNIIFHKLETVAKFFSSSLISRGLIFIPASLKTGNFNKTFLSINVWCELLLVFSPQYVINSFKFSKYTTFELFNFKSTLADSLLT